MKRSHRMYWLTILVVGPSSLAERTLIFAPNAHAAAETAEHTARERLGPNSLAAWVLYHDDDPPPLFWTRRGRWRAARIRRITGHAVSPSNRPHNHNGG